MMEPEDVTPEKVPPSHTQEVVEPPINENEQPLVEEPP